MNLLISSTIAVALTSAFPAFAGERVEDAAAAVGSVLGAPAGGFGSVAGALLGKYGVRRLDQRVSNAIDRHFDRQDQQFANRTGITISYPQRGVTIRPQR